MKATGRNIRRLRLKSGLTVGEICSSLGIENQVSYFKWQRGQSLPSLSHFVKLAMIFRTSIDNILAVRVVNTKEEEESNEAPLPYFFLYNG